MPDIGGAVTRLKNLLKILNSMNYKVTIVTTVPHYPKGDISPNYQLGWKFIEKTGNITIIRMRMLTISHDSFLNRLINYLFFILMSVLALPSIGKVDFIWAISPNFFGNISGFIYKFTKRVPLILNVDDFWPDVVQELGVVRSGFLLRIANLFNLLMYRSCDAITPISFMIKKKIIEKYRVHSSKIHVIEVGVDYKKFINVLNNVSMKFNTMKERERRIANDSKQMIVYSGILGPAYDFGMLLRAIKLLEEELETFQLIIHGNGPLKAYIRSQIAKLGLKRTKVLSSYLPFNDYMNLLYNASIFLLPMKKGVFSETAIPAKLFTYLMLDRPIVSTKGGDVEIILKKSNAGIVVPHDYKVLSEVLKMLIENKTIYSQFCRKGSIYAEKHFDLKIIRKKVNKLLICIKNKGK